MAGTTSAVSFQQALPSVLVLPPELLQMPSPAPTHLLCPALPPGVHVDIPVLTDKDIDDLVNFAVRFKMDYVAASFVQSGNDVRCVGWWTDRARLCAPGRWVGW